MIVLDSTIVAVAIPAMQRDLGFTPAGVAWVVNGYLVAFAGFLLLAGRLGDLLGARRVFLTGLTVFTAASLLCGLAPTAGLLVAGRFVQGVGGALASAVVLGMIVRCYPEPGPQARAMGIFSFTQAGGAAIGFVAGGVLTDLAGWPAIFLINVPIGLTAYLAARRLLPTAPVPPRSPEPAPAASASAPPASAQPASAQPASAQPASAPLASAQPASAPPASLQPASAQPAPARSVPALPAVDRPMSAQPASRQPASVPSASAQSGGAAAGRPVRGRIDLLGAALITAGLSLGVYAIVAVSEPNPPAPAWSLAAGAFLLVVAFLIRQSRAPEPLVPLRLLRRPWLLATNATVILIMAAGMGFQFVNTLFLQRVMGFDTLRTGLAFLPTPVVIGVVSLFVAARLTARFGPRRVLLAGLTLLAAGLLLLVRVPVTPSYLVDVLPALIVMGLGIGITVPAVMMMAMTGTSTEDTGLVSGLTNTAQQAGAALGLAVLAAVAAGRTSAQTTAGVPELPALRDGYSLAFLTAAIFALAAALIALLALRRTPALTAPPVPATPTTPEPPSSVPAAPVPSGSLSSVPAGPVASGSLSSVSAGPVASGSLSSVSAEPVASGSLSSVPAAPTPAGPLSSLSTPSTDPEPHCLPAPPDAAADPDAVSAKAMSAPSDLPQSAPSSVKEPVTCVAER
ncbi:MFS family permease [Actinoplanes octamycinicus]|uniref:MFS family permease n=4 Tax=Actinoplanes octamycinicus TaxID=135948 RepID=A0A7W7M7D2_9ACTN|nr:MFS family permease [Actinoplanes octamycinicus]